MKKIVIVILTSILFSSCKVLTPTTYYVTGESENGDMIQTSIPSSMKPRVGKILIVRGVKYKLSSVSKKKPTNTFR